MVKDERNTYTIHQDPNLEEVQIADEVVAIIAALAATEVEGVASMAGNITNDLIARLGMKNLSRGVKVDVLEGIVTVSALVLKYGYSIMDVSAKIQEKVKAAVENMTGLTVADVNIRIAGVDMGDRHEFQKSVMRGDYERFFIISFTCCPKSVGILFCNMACYVV